MNTSFFFFFFNLPSLNNTLCNFPEWFSFCLCFHNQDQKCCISEESWTSSLDFWCPPSLGTRSKRVTVNCRNSSSSGSLLVRHNGWEGPSYLIHQGQKRLSTKIKKINICTRTVLLCRAIIFQLSNREERERNMQQNATKAPDRR